MFAKRLAAVLAALGVSHAAHAHGIAGNRLFPGTLAFDDPAVGDELILPAFLSLQHPAGGGTVVDNTVAWALMRRLTPTLVVGVDNGWSHRNWGAVQRSGFETTQLTIKSEIYRNDPHETLIAAGLTWGIGRSGAQGIDANRPDTIQPAMFFGKGFGDLPAELSWFRPFGISGAVVAELPTSTTATNFGFDPSTGQPGPMQTSRGGTLHWGFSIQYSTFYLTRRYTGGPPKAEPLNQFVPLVEFAFDSPRGQKTTATMNPGLAYVATTWQVAVEAIVPLSSETGRTVGVRTQLLFFLDDLVPSVFGKPLLSR